MGEELVEILMGEEVAEPRVQFCSSSQDNDNVENPAADQTQQSDDDKTLAVNTFFKLQEKLTAKISEANIQEYEALVARQWHCNTEVPGKRYVLVQLCLTQIPHWVAWDRILWEAGG